MSRKLDKKVIQARLKENKALMRSHKGALSRAVKTICQGGAIDQKEARQDLTHLMRAATAITSDNAKMQIIKQQETNNGD